MQIGKTAVLETPHNDQQAVEETQYQKNTLTEGGDVFILMAEWASQYFHSFRRWGG